MVEWVVLELGVPFYCDTMILAGQGSMSVMPDLLLNPLHVVKQGLGPACSTSYIPCKCLHSRFQFIFHCSVAAIRDNPFLKSVVHTFTKTQPNHFENYSQHTLILCTPAVGGFATDIL